MTETKTAGCPYRERGLECRNAGSDGICRCRASVTPQDLGTLARYLESGYAMIQQLLEQTDDQALVETGNNVLDTLAPIVNMLYRRARPTIPSDATESSVNYRRLAELFRVLADDPSLGSVSDAGEFRAEVAALLAAYKPLSQKELAVLTGASPRSDSNSQAGTATATNATERTLRIALEQLLNNSYYMAEQTLEKYCDETGDKIRISLRPSELYHLMKGAIEWRTECRRLRDL